MGFFGCGWWWWLFLLLLLLLLWFLLLCLWFWWPLFILPIIVIMLDTIHNKADVRARFQGKSTQRIPKRWYSSSILGSWNSHWIKITVHNSINIPVGLNSPTLEPQVRVEAEPFAKGAMRICHRWARGETLGWKNGVLPDLTLQTMGLLQWKMIWTRFWHAQLFFSFFLRPIFGISLVYIWTHWLTQFSHLKWSFWMGVFSNKPT
jgi:hypothetical protein